MHWLKNGQRKDTREPHMQNSKQQVLIIGSGVGGLSTGIILQKLGYQVTIAEKNRDPGGLMRSYLRDGISCETGVHYLGSLADGEVLDTFFSYLGVKGSIPVTRMGKEGVVDRYLFQNGHDKSTWHFDLPEGIDAFTQRLLQTFPDEADCIQTVATHISKTADQLHNLDLLFATDNDFSLLDHTEPYGELLDSLGCSPKLRGVLGMASSWIGVPLADCPAYFHNMALASYLSSSWRLTGTGSEMANAFVQSFEKLGGRLLTNAETNSISVENRVVKGVELASGEQIRADTVIAAVHPQVVLRMLPDGAVKPSYGNRIRNLKNTHSVFSVHASLDATYHPPLDHNIFSIDTTAAGDIEDLRFYQVRESEREGRSLLSILTSGHDELWQPWTETKSGRRGTDYCTCKKQHAKLLLAEAATVLGELRGLQVLDVATPLSYRDWLNSPRGSAYGVLRSANQTLATAMLNRTAVKGLYLAGQNVLAPGVIGTIMGSFSTVKLILGQEAFLQQVVL